MISNQNDFCDVYSTQTALRTQGIQAASDAAKATKMKKTMISSCSFCRRAENHMMPPSEYRVLERSKIRHLRGRYEL